MPETDITPSEADQRIQEACVLIIQQWETWNALAVMRCQVSQDDSRFAPEMVGRISRAFREAAAPALKAEGAREERERCIKAIRDERIAVGKKPREPMYTDGLLDGMTDAIVAITAAQHPQRAEA